MTTPPRKRSENGFVTPLKVQSVDPRTWVLLEDLIWVGSEGDVITVPAGFTTDFATVPQVFQSIVPRTGAWTKAAVVHDWLCVLRQRHEAALKLWEADPNEHPKPDPPAFDAVETDAVFEKIMVEDDVYRWKASMIWCAVRWGAAGSSYRREDWWTTFGRVLLISIVVLTVALAVLTGWYLGVDWAVESLS